MGCLLVGAELGAEGWEHYSHRLGQQKDSKPGKFIDRFDKLLDKDGDLYNSCWLGGSNGRKLRLFVQ
jgi:hypothetical protein